jgi:hypothetical protein
MGIGHSVSRKSAKTFFIGLFAVAQFGAGLKIREPEAAEIPLFDVHLHFAGRTGPNFFLP